MHVAEYARISFFEGWLILHCKWLSKMAKQDLQMANKHMKKLLNFTDH